MNDRTPIYHFGLKRIKDWTRLANSRDFKLTRQATGKVNDRMKLLLTYSELLLRLVRRFTFGGYFRMAHHKSSLKSIRQDKIRRVRNKSARTRIRSAVKEVRSSIDSQKMDDAKQSYAVMVPILDKLAAEKIIHKNKAARLKSRLNRQIRSTGQSTSK